MKPKHLLRSVALLAIVTSLLVNLLPVHGADSADTKAAILALEKKYDEASNKKDAQWKISREIWNTHISGAAN